MLETLGSYVRKRIEQVALDRRDQIECETCACTVHSVQARPRPSAGHGLPFIPYDGRRASRSLGSHGVAWAWSWCVPLCTALGAAWSGMESGL